MKLNLVPSGSKKSGGGLAGAIIGSVVLFLLSAAAFVFLLTSSKASLDAAKERVVQETPNATQAVLEAQKAQAIIDSTRTLATNIELKRNIDVHNSKYTKFYQQVLPYVPGFLRLTRIAVEPVDSTTCQLTLNGVLYSAQQFADATLALYRIPGAQAVSRDGYAPRPVIRPGLTEEDQVGRPFRAGGAPLPLDPVERINAMAAAAESQTTGFQNLNNFGTADPTARGPMQTGSAVTYTVLLSSQGVTLPPGWDYDFMVPNPTATLAAIASGKGPTPPPGQPTTTTGPRGEDQN